MIDIAAEKVRYENQRIDDRLSRKKLGRSSSGKLVKDQEETPQNLSERSRRSSAVFNGMATTETKREEILKVEG